MSAAPTSTDLLEGSIERVTYYNDETGYTVIKVLPSSPLGFWSATDQEGLVVVVGELPEVQPGESVRLTGAWINHAKHGRQFRAHKLERVSPATVEGLKRYLGSGLIKYVRKQLAGRIVDRFGLETLDVLDHHPERLYEVEGLGEFRVKKIMEAWQQQKHIQEVMLFLQTHGVSTGLAVRIYKTYGDASIGTVEENPYRLAKDIFGVGFRTADQIAQSLGLGLDHPRRIEAGLVYALNQATDDGHLYLPRPHLIETATELLGVPPESVDAAIVPAVKAELVIIDRVSGRDGEPVEAVYTTPAYYSEAGIASRLKRHMANGQSALGDLYRVDALVEQATADSGIQLTDQQQGAVRGAFDHKVSILTGGPGTGKTTTLRALIAALKRAGRRFALASPTGRAAKRLSEATGEAASTLHRLLRYAPGSGWLHNEDNPLPVDVVIVDECSMVDAILANALIRALDVRSHLVLVGDVDQLPSVGAGDVLRDLIDSGVIPVTRLATIFRQAAGSRIISNAHRVNEGLLPEYPEGAEDFFLFRIDDDPDRAADLVVDIVKSRLPQRFGLNPFEDVQVLAPTNRGTAGIANLNQRLQEALNPPGRPAQMLIAGRLYRVGDKVIQTINNYEKEVFNGDMGRIHSFDVAEQIMKVSMDARFVEYDLAEAHELTHAYAITVHRSQGSEYPVVVMPILTQHYMLLQRNLLYTAITRARRMVVLVGSNKAIAIAVKNNAVASRYTALAERMRGG